MLGLGGGNIEKAGSGYDADAAACRAEIREARKALAQSLGKAAESRRAAEAGKRRLRSLEAMAIVALESRRPSAEVEAIRARIAEEDKRLAGGEALLAVLEDEVSRSRQALTAAMARLAGMAAARNSGEAFSRPGGGRPQMDALQGPPMRVSIKRGN